MYTPPHTQQQTHHRQRTSPPNSLSWKKNIADTGAQISVILPKPKQKHTLSACTLQSENASKIETYREKSLTFNLDLWRPFLCILQAQVKTQILGADLLTHVHLSGNMTTHSLIDSDTKLMAKGITSICTSKGISSVIPTVNGLQELIGKFSTITTPLKHTDKIRHTAKYYTTRSGSSTHTSPSRLSPEKYKIAKDGFQQMLQLDIIRPLSSPHSSPHGSKTKHRCMVILWGFQESYRKNSSR